MDSEYDEEEGGHQKTIVEKKPLTPATTNGNVCSEDVVDLVDCLVGGDEDCAARPIGQKKAKQLRDAAQRQIDIDEKAAQAMQSRAETHKLQLEFKVFSSIGDAEEAKEWILPDRKKVINNKKRAAEAEEERLKKKKSLLIQLIFLQRKKMCLLPKKTLLLPTMTKKRRRRRRKKKHHRNVPLPPLLIPLLRNLNLVVHQIFVFLLTMTKRSNRLLGTTVACATVFATRLVANTMAN